MAPASSRGAAKGACGGGGGEGKGSVASIAVDKRRKEGY